MIRRWVWELGIWWRGNAKFPWPPWRERLYWKAVMGSMSLARGATVSIKVADDDSAA